MADDVVRGTCALHPEPAASILALLTALNLLNYLDRYVLSAVLRARPRTTSTSRTSSRVASRPSSLSATSRRARSSAPWPTAATARGADEAHRRRASPSGARRPSPRGSRAERGRSLAARAVVGVGEASYATLAPTLIDDMAPPEKKGRWLSDLLRRHPRSARRSGYLVGGLARSTHRVARGVLRRRRARDPAQRARASSSSSLDGTSTGEPRESHEPARLLRIDRHARARIPLYRRGVLGYAAQTFAIGGFGYWAPKFLRRVYELPVSEAGDVVRAILVVAGGIGTLARRRLGGSAGRARDGARRATARSPRARIDAARLCPHAERVAAPLAAAAVLRADTRKCSSSSPSSASSPRSSPTRPVNAALLRSGAHRASRERDGAVSIFADPRPRRPLVAARASARCADHRPRCRSRCWRFRFPGAQRGTLVAPRASPRALCAR